MLKTGSRPSSGILRKVTILGSFIVVLLSGACSTGSESAQPHGEANKPAPTTARPYPFGQAQDKAPQITNGETPVIKRISTTKPFVFITMDDGAVKQPDAPDLIQQSDGHPVLFLNQRYVHGHEAYFKSILDKTGAELGDHTVDHPNLRGKPFDFQKKEICDDADAFATELGRRPTLFRPPFGNYDNNTLRAAQSCGMRATVLWTASVNDGVVQFQEGNKLRAGDIVLMHFRKTFVEDYNAFLAQAKKDSLTPVPLADFLA